MSPLSKGDLVKQRLAESMLDLVQAHGYHGTGLNAVVERAGAPKGSLYFHFPGGKEQLGELAIAIATRQFTDLIQGVLDPSAEPVAMVESIINTLAQMLMEGDFEIGCPVSVLTLETASESPALRAACAAAYEAWTAPLAQFLRAQGRSASAAEALASSAVSLVEGAMIVCRARRDTRPLLDTAQTLETIFALPAARGQENAS